MLIYLPKTTAKFHTLCVHRNYLFQTVKTKTHHGKNCLLVHDKHLCHFLQYILYESVFELLNICNQIRIK
jgi:hypothetical protein